MVRLVTIAFALTTAALFGVWLPLEQFLILLQPMIVALSIMSAALLVRLNRGMPTLDWKTLESTERKVLTQNILDLTRQYAIVLGLHVATLIVLLFLAINASKGLTPVVQAAGMTLAGGLCGLCLSRMTYIVWRDFDIVRLQKKLIDEAADRETIDNASADALSKVASIRASGLRSASKPDAPSPL